MFEIWSRLGVVVSGASKEEVQVWFAEHPQVRDAWVCKIS